MLFNPKYIDYILDYHKHLLHKYRYTKYNLQEYSWQSLYVNEIITTCVIILGTR